MIFLFSIIIFLELIQYIIIFDIILSWLSILGIRFRPQFIANIIDTLYNAVKRIIPTTFGPLDFAPLVIFVIIFFIKSLLHMMFPELQDMLLELGK